MTMPDTFSPDVFKMTSLTDAINNLKYNPGRIGSLGIFHEQGISTLDLMIEENNGVLTLVDVASRNSPGKVINAGKRKGRSFRVPHLPEVSAIMADEVQGVRLFGSEDQTETVQLRINDRLQSMRNNIDYTMESHRLAAIKGTYYDANGGSTSLFTEFGVSQQIVNFILATATTKIATKCENVLKAIEDALDGVNFSGVRVLCGRTFFTDLSSHALVRDTYLNTQMAGSLREDPRLEFSFGGLTFERYRGTSAVNIADAEAYAIPQGVERLFVTRFAPANYNETVNTIGLPYYSKAEEMKMGKGWELEAQSNPINLCTRPASVIKLTAA